MDWYCLVMIVALGLIACWGVSHFRDLADVADERRGRTVEIIERLADAVAYQEPTRVDADDKFRDRFVFCDRITDHGHAFECPWLAAVRRVRPATSTPQLAGE